MDGFDVTTIRLPRQDIGEATLADAVAGLAKLGEALAVSEQINAAAKLTDTSATEAQREAGNYRKGKVTFHGLQISIENPRGSTRSGKGKDGAKWEILMAHHYGYVNGTTGRDGDAVDVFIGPDPACELVFVVNQVDPKTGRFDEGKVLFGFHNEQSAREGYLANYEKGWKGLGSIVSMTMPQFKEWLEHDSTGEVKPLRAARIAKAAGVSSLAADEGSLPQPAERALPVVWASRNQGMLAVAEKFSGVLHGHGSSADGEVAGTPGQRQRLFAGQLRVGGYANAIAKQAEQPLADARRANDDLGRLGDGIANRQRDVEAATRQLRVGRRTGVDDAGGFSPEQQPHADVPERDIAGSRVGEAVGNQLSNAQDANQQDGLVDRASVKSDLKDGFEFSDFADGTNHRFDVHHKGRNVGYAVTYAANNGEGDHQWVDGLSVKKRFRGQGLGRQLLQRVIAKHGHGDLRLRANPYNDEPLEREQLKAFYGRMGFEEYGNDHHMLRRAGVRPERSDASTTGVAETAVDPNAPAAT